MASNMASTTQPAPSIASLTVGISFLTEAKQQWNETISGRTSEALRESVQALRDYTSQMEQTVAMLQTSIARVNTTLTLYETEYTHRMQALFDEPMAELQKNITAIREDFQETPRVGIVPPSSQRHGIPERVAPMCVLFETYVGVNGERMRLPPDVMEGIIPMAACDKSRVFHREITRDDFRKLQHRMTDRSIETYALPRRISKEHLSNILRAHRWCVFPSNEFGAIGIAGSAHFVDGGGAEHYLLFSCRGGGPMLVWAQDSHASLAELIVRAVIKDIESVKSSTETETEPTQKSTAAAAASTTQKQTPIDRRKMREQKRLRSRR